MNYIDTSVYMRAASNVASHVETDIVDASGHYKPYSKYDTIWVPDPSQFIPEDPRQLRLTHLCTCVDTSTQAEIDALVAAADPCIFSRPRVF